MSDTPERSDDPITTLVREVRDGKPGALASLYEVAYERLSVLARRQRARWAADTTLDTSAIVSETFMKLNAVEGMGWEDRRHFFAVAAKAMRHLLVSHARTKKRKKRGGGAEPVELHDGIPMVEEEDLVLALNDAIERMQAIDSRASQVVELHFLVGLTWAEVAEVIGVSTVTVRRDWIWARAWLRTRIEGDLGLSASA